MADRIEVLLSEDILAIEGFCILSPITIRQLHQLENFAYLWNQTETKCVTDEGYACIFFERTPSDRPIHYDVCIMTPFCNFLVSDDDGSDEDYIKRPLSGVSKNLRKLILNAQYQFRLANNSEL